uniref:DUF4172 domain-containing protein n=1 Tax=uncultured Dysgonomonas sp. TaxID=206096 RepID=UPI002616849D|nr:DUF4172 domain-containing protein [uncultured Dysgonomonas sp.]
MKRIYIWQYEDWANFHCDEKTISYYLGKVIVLQERLIAQMSMIGFDMITVFK